MFSGNRSKILSTTGIITATVLGLFLSSFYNYLLFHSLIEITTIAVAFTLFILTWNTRLFLSNNYLGILGIGYAFIALIDLLHTLAYKGMNVFPGFGANLPTQLWIAARSLQAVTLCIAPLCMERRTRHRAVFGIYAAASSLLVAMIYSGKFPVCFIEGKGLTTFKIGCEYLMVALLLTSLYLLHWKRKHFDGTVYLLTLSSTACTALSGIMFTSYVNVYDVANMAGHFFKLAAFYLIYRALLVTGFIKPFALIFRELKQTEGELRESQDTLEEKIRERTAALRESERKYRTLAENSPDCIVRYDRQCRAIFYNPMLAQTVAVDPEIMLGKTPVEFGAGGPEVAAEYEGHIRRVLENGGSSDIELFMPHPDGGFRNHLVRFVAEWDTEGSIAGVLAIGRDITERKQAEEMLREGEREFRSLAENSPDSILRYDTACRCIYANPHIEKALGVSAGGMSGKTPMGLFPAGEYREYQDRIEEVLRTAQGAEIEVVVPDIGEGIRCHHVRFTAERGENGDVVGVLVIGRDITERKRAEQALRDKQQRLSDMALELSLAEERERRRIATHLHDDIGQDLALARIKLGLLAKGSLTGGGVKILDDAREIIDGIIKNVRFFTRLISPPILESAGLEAALKWLGRQVETDYGLRVLFHDDLSEKTVSREIQAEIYNATRELLINVAKHAETDTALVAVGRENDGIVIMVEDDGIGFDPDAIEENLIREGGGFGLFNIRRRIIYQGGTFHVASAPGAGTRVTIGMPLSG